MQVLEKVSTPAFCWSCGEPIPAGQPFCLACARVQPPQPSTYFGMFGLPVRLNIDLAALEKHFYHYSRKLHPDRHARASAEEQAWSLVQGSLLNDAYRTLKEPVERTRYLLTLEGVQLEDAKTSGETEQSKGPAKVPADLLEEVFELNMQLEEMRQNQKMGEDDPQLRRDLETANTQFSAQLVAVDDQLRAQWSAWDSASDQEDVAGKTAAKEAMVSLLQRRNYLRNLVRDVGQTLGES